MHGIALRINLVRLSRRTIATLSGRFSPLSWKDFWRFSALGVMIGHQIFASCSLTACNVSPPPLSQTEFNPLASEHMP